MSKERREMTEEERERLMKNNKRQYSLVAAIIWTLTSVVWIVVLCLNVAHKDPMVTVGLNIFCAVVTAACAVRHFIDWRKMKADTEAESTDPVSVETSEPLE